MMFDNVIKLKPGFDLLFSLMLQKNKKIMMI